MTRFAPALIILFIYLTVSEARAQASAVVSDPVLELRNNRLNISYDILNSDPSERFTVSVDIRDENGDPVASRNLTGDIGQNISGGRGKNISWDLEADQIFMNGDIYVTIYADLHVSRNRVAEKHIRRKEINTSLSHASVVLQSIPLPGLGLSRMTGNPHWIRGVAGYGCLTGLILYNRKASVSYENFLSAETTETAESYLDQSTRQDRVSKAFGYGALAIWASDLTWTWIRSSQLRNPDAAGQEQGLKMNLGFDPVFDGPVLGFIFRF